MQLALSDTVLQLTLGLAKNWATQHSTNFCFAIVLQLSTGHYKFGDINNNELLIIIINLAAVWAGQISNTSSSPSPERWLQFSNKPNKMTNEKIF